MLVSGGLVRRRDGPEIAASQVAPAQMLRSGQLPNSVVRACSQPCDAVTKL